VAKTNNWRLEYGAPHNERGGSTFNSRRGECHFRCVATSGSCSALDNQDQPNIHLLCQNRSNLEPTYIVANRSSIAGALEVVKDANTHPCPNNYVANGGGSYMLTNNTSDFTYMASMTAAQNTGNDVTTWWRNMFFCTGTGGCATDYESRTTCIPLSSSSGLDYFPMPRVQKNLDNSRTWPQSGRLRLVATCPANTRLLGGGCRGDSIRWIMPFSSFSRSTTQWTCDFECIDGAKCAAGVAYNVAAKASCVATTPTTGTTTGVPTTAATTGVPTTGLSTGVSATTGVAVTGARHEFNSAGIRIVCTPLLFFVAAVLLVAARTAL
jgi:hypothetical protein